MSKKIVKLISKDLIDQLLSCVKGTEFTYIEPSGEEYEVMIADAKHDIGITAVNPDTQEMVFCVNLAEPTQDMFGMRLPPSTQEEYDRLTERKHNVMVSIAVALIKGAKVITTTDHTSKSGPGSCPFSS